MAWVQAVVWLGIVWAPPSGSRHSPVTPGRHTDRGLHGFPPLKGLGARALYPSALPACLPLVPYKQAALSLVRTPSCRDREQSSNKIYTGRPLGGHVPTLPGRFHTAGNIVGGRR
eukprot:2511902-Pyramimonas_sp.AAC.1